MENLLRSTERLLGDLPRWVTFSEISKCTGLSTPWLSMFAAGVIEDPGVKRVQRLHDFLCLMEHFLKPESLPFEMAGKLTTPVRGLDRKELAGVYEIYAGDAPLYVGRSANLAHRLAQHSRDKALRALGPTLVRINYTSHDLGPGRLSATLKAMESAKVQALQPMLNTNLKVAELPRKRSRRNLGALEKTRPIPATVTE